MENRAAGDQAPPQRGADVLIRTIGLTKAYGQRLAVNGLGLDVRRGDVFGLLGPNGSGKTTTLRMLLGLVWPTGGQIELFGADVNLPGKRKEALQRVGAIVEQPSFYPFLSGRENLAGIATFAGLPADAATEARIRSLLEQVGLADRARDSYRKYSLGMKQRLGIAAALLTDPELVLLDEPTNGLDPAGMVEVRALIGQLAQRGTTVLLSSHLLHEVQQVCTRVAILKEGVLLAQGQVDELLASGSGVQIAFSSTDDMARAIEVLRAAQEGGTSWLNGARYIAPEPGAPTPPGGWYLLVNTAAERAGDVNRLLGEHGLYAAEVRRREASLEQFFLALTGSYGAPTPPINGLVPAAPAGAQA
ncbi:MAG TPA: ABC transporter ATP-binding protein [Ktedonobacterales bacterium]|nr:ABC transporter ATP-binding protein [Ktedonobacterales bacterium]